MRLWSLHPKMLDQKGLGGLWREGIGQAQPALIKLLSGEAEIGVGAGYHNHAQLRRFLATERPLETLGSYLLEVHKEAVRRGYKYNKGLIKAIPNEPVKMMVSFDQVLYEFNFLQSKLLERSPDKYENNNNFLPWVHRVHPMFETVTGPIEDWERVK